MANKPKKVTLSKQSTVDIINALRTGLSNEYKSKIPVAKSIEDCKTIGKLVTNYEPFENEFVNALVNRIAFVIIRSKSYENPWSMFKKGFLDYGETIEEVFVDLAKPYKYDVEKAEVELFKREKPDVKSAFHYVNFKELYKTTVQEYELRKAFLSNGGMSELVTKIVDELYVSERYDEFLIMKYMIGRAILNGYFHMEDITNYKDGKNGAENATIAFKTVSNAVQFMSGKYNIAGVKSYTDLNDQYIIMQGAFDAVNDVTVLASAFNMDRVQFLGNRVLVDSFANNESSERLNEIFKDYVGVYKPFTQQEIDFLEKIPAVLIDKDFFMVYDTLFEMRSVENGQGLYWNYNLHSWKTFSFSPFVTAVAFTYGNEIPTTEGLKLTVESGTEVGVDQLPKTVTISVTSDNADFNISNVTLQTTNGSYVSTENKLNVVLTANLKAGDSVTVTATDSVTNETGSIIFNIVEYGE